MPRLWGCSSGYTFTAALPTSLGTDRSTKSMILSGWRYRRLEGLGVEIARHKTAISRTDLSRPVRRAISDGILRNDLRLFDYGCGRGDDQRMLGALGFEAAGWDPVHRPDAVTAPAPIVNLGFVVNVIEDAREREAALRGAWDLAEQVLIVAARLHM